MTNTAQKAAIIDPIDAELAALLNPDIDPVDSLFNDAGEGDVIIADDVVADDSAEIDLLVGTVEMEEVRDAVHAEQDGDDTVADIGEVAAAAAKAGKKTAKKAASDKPKRVTTAGMTPSQIIKAKLGARLNDFLALELNDANLDPAALQSKVDSYLAEFDKQPKKVGEKIVNLLTHLSDGVGLSNYTEIALKVLAKGSASSKDIREAYLARPYSGGTANAQSSQMMALLPVLRIANRNGSGLVLNPNSVLATMLTPA